MADKVYTAETVFTANTGPLYRTMSGLGGSLSAKMGAIGGAAGTAFSSAFTVGATAGLAALAGAGILAVWSTKLASDSEEAASKFEAVFKEAAGNVRKQMDEFAGAAGRSREELRAMAADSGALLSAMGFTRDRAGELSVAVVKLAQDLSSFSNVSEQDALQALRSGISGESEPLKRFGILINQARIESEALASGLVKNKNEITPLIKAQATLNLIFKDTVDAQGDAIRTSGSFANTLRGLQGSIKDAGTSIGRIFLPAATELNIFLRGGVAYIDQFSDQFREWGLTIGEITKNVLGQVSMLAVKWRDAFTGTMGDAIKSLTGGGIKDFRDLVTQLLESTALLTADFEKTWSAVKVGADLAFTTLLKGAVDFGAGLIVAFKMGFGMLPQFMQAGANKVIDGFNVILGGALDLYTKLGAGFDSLLDHMVGRIKKLASLGGIWGKILGAGADGLIEQGPTSGSKISGAMASAKGAPGGAIQHGNIDAGGVAGLMDGLSGFLGKLSGDLGKRQQAKAFELAGLFLGMAKARADKAAAAAPGAPPPAGLPAMPAWMKSAGGMAAALFDSAKGLKPGDIGGAIADGVAGLVGAGGRAAAALAGGVAGMMPEPEPEKKRQVSMEMVGLSELANRTQMSLFNAKKDKSIEKNTEKTATLVAGLLTEIKTLNGTLVKKFGDAVKTINVGLAH